MSLGELKDLKLPFARWHCLLSRHQLGSGPNQQVFASAALDLHRGENNYLSTQTYCFALYVAEYHP